MPKGPQKGSYLSPSVKTVGSNVSSLGSVPDLDSGVGVELGHDIPRYIRGSLLWAGGGVAVGGGDGGGPVRTLFWVDLKYSVVTRSWLPVGDARRGPPRRKMVTPRRHGVSVPPRTPHTPTPSSVGTSGSLSRLSIPPTG